MDASQERARRRLREEEEGLVHARHPRKLSKGKNFRRPPPRQHSSYGRFAESEGAPPIVHSSPTDPPTSADHPVPEGRRVIDGAKNVYHAIKGDDEEAQLQRRFRQDLPAKLPSDAYDLVVEDRLATEEEMVRDRRRGEPGGGRKKVYRQTYTPKDHDEADSPRPPPPADVPGHKIEVKDSVAVETPDGEAEEVVRLRVQKEVQQAREVEPPSASEASENPWN